MAFGYISLLQDGCHYSFFVVILEILNEKLLGISLGY